MTARPGLMYGPSCGARRRWQLVVLGSVVRRAVSARLRRRLGRFRRRPRQDSLRRGRGEVEPPAGPARTPAAAGLGAAELVGDRITEKGLVTRARARVFKQSLSVRDMTPPMRNPPARRLEERGRRGWWPRFPSSPQDPHDRLRAVLGLDRLCVSSAAVGWDATQDLAGDLDLAVGRAVDLRLADGDRAGALAVRRAVLTIGLDLMECCDDSSGYLGQVLTTAMVTYAGTDWRSTGIPPQVFWPDFVEIATLLANYGVPVGEEVAVYRLAGVAPDLDLVCDIAGGLHAEYTAARMTWHAGQVRRQRGHALAAATGTGPT